MWTKTRNKSSFGCKFEDKYVNYLITVVFLFIMKCCKMLCYDSERGTRWRVVIRLTFNTFSWVETFSALLWGSIKMQSMLDIPVYDATYELRNSML